MQNSSLVPIIKSPVSCKRVAIYNYNILKDNPISSLLILNETNLTLESGPVTVSEESMFLGENLIGVTKPNEKIFIRYAVELCVSIVTDDNSIVYKDSDEPAVITIENGILKFSKKKLRETTYKIKNKYDDKSIELYLEQEVSSDWLLSDSMNSVYVYTVKK